MITKDNFHSKFIAKIEHERKLASLSCRQLCKLLGCYPATYCRFTHGLPVSSTIIFKLLGWLHDQISNRSTTSGKSNTEFEAIATRMRQHTEEAIEAIKISLFSLEETTGDVRGG